MEKQLKIHPNLKPIAAATLLALATISPTAQAASNAELEAQVKALTQLVEQLRQDVAKKTDSSNVATQEDVEGVRADLENFKYDQSRSRERNTVKSARDTTFFGVVQIRAQGQSESTTSGNPAPTDSRKSTFEVPTALFGLRGNLYRDYVDGKNLDYQMSFTYAKRTTQAGGTSDLNLADAFVRYHLTSTNGGLEVPRVNLTLGQQLLPFGLEAQAPEDLRPTINVSQASARLGLFTRQVGAILRGDVEPYVDYAANYRAPLAEFALGVVNGNTSNKVDDNGHKDILGRAAFTLPVPYASWLRELKIGASVYKGKKNIASGTALLTGSGKKDRYGFDIYYNHAPFGATYEYIQGRDDRALGGIAQEVKSEGHTLTLFYTVGDQFFNSIKSVAKFDDSWPQSVQFFYRHDQFNPNTNRSADTDHGDSVRINTLGLNWFFAQTTKLQLGINRWDYRKSTATQKDFTELQAQVQYTF
jgi:hypothetical protein